MVDYSPVPSGRFCTYVIKHFTTELGLVVLPKPFLMALSKFFIKDVSCSLDRISELHSSLIYTKQTND